jgi:hypothetical protein
MITEKNKNKSKDKDKETVKTDKKMPELDRSRKVDSQKSKENQEPNKFGHKLSKEETYEPKRTKEPKSETYE